MAQDSNDFEALSRQYWTMWGDAMRGAVPQTGADAGLQGMRDGFDAWTRLAGAGSGGGMDAVLGHFNRQNGDWFARMQQLAAGFAGRPHSAQDIAGAWRQMLGANPFEGLLQGMRGPGMEGLEQWSEAAAPWLRNLRHEAAGMLGMPAFGFAREHQERLQALGQAQLRWQDALAAYNALMAKTSQDAYVRFESRLAEREEPGRQLTSVRALFDLWVDAAEEAYAQVALSPEYRKAYGELVNAQMQLRAGSHAIAEQAAAMLGMPGRTELDSAHRKIAELERQLRRMQRRADEAGAPAMPATSAAPATPTKAKQAARVAPAKRAAAKNVAPARKASSAKAPAKASKTTARKPARPTARKR